MDTSTPPPDEQPPAAEPGSTATDAGPRVTATEARDLGRLVRTRDHSPEGRYVAGVAGGLGRHFDIDPAILRVAFVVLVFFGGAGLLVYGACWLLVPDERTGEAPINVDDRTRTFALYLAGALGVLAVLGDTVGRFDFPWPVAIVALILLAIFGNRGRMRGTDRQDGTTVTSAAPPGAPTYVPAYGPGAPSTTSAVPTASAATGPTATAPGGAAPGWVPPTPQPVYVPQPDPKRRGPILFWFTLALIALLEGVLGIVDAAPGADIPGSAYAALAVGVTGLMLVLGAFWGRAGGLILIGLVTTLALVISVAATEWDWEGDRTLVQPASAAALDERYTFGAGDMVIDLREVGDPSALAGRHLHVEGNVGEIEIVVPDGVTVDARGTVDGPGSVEVFGDKDDGVDNRVDGTRFADDPGDAVDTAPRLTIEAVLDVGVIEIVEADERPTWRGPIEERSIR